MWVEGELRLLWVLLEGGGLKQKLINIVGNHR